ncbi:hypothetical protein HMI54_015828, partial [Coelomomyces lativittatus]
MEATKRENVPSSPIQHLEPPTDVKDQLTTLSKRSKWIDSLSDEEDMESDLEEGRRLFKEKTSTPHGSTKLKKKKKKKNVNSQLQPNTYDEVNTSMTTTMTTLTTTHQEMSSSSSSSSEQDGSLSSSLPLPSSPTWMDMHRIPDFLHTTTWIHRCPSVDEYEKLNRIDEGAYGVVYRARERKTGEVVALKKMKLDHEKYGFPVTALREIATLLACKHPHIINVRKIVMGTSLTSVFIVMDFLEHDLKTLLNLMPHPFTASEIKTLIRQLLKAVGHLHANWIFHRDLKTSNLLMNNVGEIKVADFGLARYFSDPPPRPLTQLVVTLWYRAPELLLGATEYTSAIDLWSVGCIFAEIVYREPLFPGQGELDQLDRIFKVLGRPPESLLSLPQAKNLHFQRFPEFSLLPTKFHVLTQLGRDLLEKLLCLDPNQRISAKEALLHPYFKEHPPPKDPSMFPTFPSKASGE